MKLRAHLPTFLALVTLVANSPAAIHYVNLNSATPVSPYINWTSAATNIQDAVSVSDPGDVVLVTNGVYQAGLGQNPNGVTVRLEVTNAVTVQSVNGASATHINGSHNMG